MNENYTLEELEAFLYGELPADKAKKLEEDIKTDLALRSELEALKISREAIDMAGWKEMIQLSQAEFLLNRTEDKKVKPLNSGSADFFLWSKRIAASMAFVLVAMAGYLLISVSPESITSGQVDYRIPVMRSSENLQTELQEAFAEKEFQKVIDLGSQLDALSIEASFLVGMAHLQLNQFAAAEEAFLAIEQSNQQNQSLEFADQVDYYLVKAYLSTGQLEEAEVRMRKIIDDPNHTYHQNFGKSDLFKIFILKLKN